MFDQFPFFRSDSFDEAQAIHAARRLELSLREPLRRGEAMRTVANVYETPLLGFYGYRYGKSVELNATEQNPDFWVSVPGQSRHYLPCRPASPGDDDAMVIPAAHGMLGMRLDGAAVTEYIEHYIGEVMRRPLRVRPETRRIGPADRYIAQRLNRLSRASRIDVLHLARPKEAMRLLEEIIEALLLFRAHNHTGFVRRASLAPSPRDVRRALEFIHAYAAEQPSLADLSRISGVPGRTLSLHFKEFVGASPIAYLNRVRLQNVRTSLRKGDVQHVQEAARAQGFVHMGRFSASYQRAFAEHPSETLRRIR